MTVLCGDTDEYDDCEFPDPPEGTELAVGYRHLCPRCGRRWELVEMFDCKLWQSVMLFDADANAVDQP